MTEDQKYEIAVLAENYNNASLRFECMAMRNCYGLTAEESAKQSIDYHIAETEKTEAYARLTAAKTRIATA